MRATASIEACPAGCHRLISEEMQFVHSVSSEPFEKNSAGIPFGNFVGCYFTTLPRQPLMCSDCPYQGGCTVVIEHPGVRPDPAEVYFLKLSGGEKREQMIECRGNKI